MAELKTQANDADVSAFLAGIADDGKREDCLKLLELMREATGAEARMWGSNIVGFGSLPYSYASGRSGTWFLAGFSPRKQNLTLYISGGLEQHDKLLGRLGKHSIGKSCLYIKRLADVDLGVLETLVADSVANVPDGEAARTGASADPAS